LHPRSPTLHSLANPSLAPVQVALKRFIDDIAIEVIETKLIAPLGDIFSPVSVSAMPADLVTRIAGESEESRELREQLTKQLDVLTKGSDTCRRFIGARLLGENCSLDGFCCTFC
jgi:hypothetical protein